MKLFNQIIFLVLISFLSHFVISEELKQSEQSGNSHLTAKLSTMGFGLEYNHPINSVLSVGLGLNQYKYSLSENEGEVNANSDFDLSSFSMIANYHPWENGFRLRAGAYHNKNKISFEASHSGNIDIGGISYDAGDVSVNGRVDFDKLAPYIGIGYGSEPVGDNNLSFDFDLGVMKSSPSLDLNGQCTIASGNCGTFNADLAKEKNNLQKDLDELKIYPIISIGLTYRF